MVASTEASFAYQSQEQREQQEEINRVAAQQEMEIPDFIEYRSIRGLSNEVCEKLETVRPATIGQAGRISGVTPAAVSLLLIYLRALHKKRDTSRSLKSARCRALPGGT